MYRPNKSDLVLAKRIHSILSLLHSRVSMKTEYLNFALNQRHGRIPARKSNRVCLSRCLHTVLSFAACLILSQTKLETPAAQFYSQSGTASIKKLTFITSSFDIPLLSFAASSILNFPFILAYNISCSSSVSLLTV